MTVLRILAFAALFVLTNCAPAKRPGPIATKTPQPHAVQSLKPSNQNSKEIQAMGLTFWKKGILASLTNKPVTTEALQTLEPDLKELAKRHRGQYQRTSSYSNLTFPIGLKSNVVSLEDLPPTTYQLLGELTEILKREPSLLVIVHSHEKAWSGGPIMMPSFPFFAEHVTQIIEDLAGLPPSRMSAFECIDEEQGTYSITLVSKDIAPLVGEKK